MFFLTRGESGPRVVLVQALLRLKGFDVPVTGVWNEGDKMTKAVGEIRAKMNLPSAGPVDAKVFVQLVQNTKLKMIDSVDASAGYVREIAERDMRENGIDPLLNKRLSGRGVSAAVDKIIERSRDHQIASLRITAHGNRGTWISLAIGDPVHAQGDARYGNYEEMKKDWKSYIDYSHFERHRKNLARITKLFALFGSVDVHCCKIGNNRLLLQRLADTWKVPVSGALDIQHVGGEYGRKQSETWGRYDYNQFNEQVPGTFAFQGAVFTAYPDKLNLKTWAARVEASLLNIPKISLQIRQTAADVFETITNPFNF